MAPSFLSRVDDNTEPSTKSNVTARALPASWYTSLAMFELERRAIFSKKWMLLTHQLRLKQPGDWLKYDIAGYEFLLCKDRHGKITGFHNVCRHRAFPIVTADQGHSRIFACKYHGWSYGLDGKLAKAPKFQDMDNFEKSNNSLFPVHVHIDFNGFVWVNLAAENPIPWDSDFAGVDKQNRFQGYNFDDYNFDHTWEAAGDFNWKILADNYNECYHCLTSHPDVPGIADLDAYYVDTKGGHIQHFSAPPEDTPPGLVIASTFYFPNASMTVAPHFFFIQRFVALSPTKSIMRYEVYRHKDASDVDFEIIDSMFKRVMTEDKELCNYTQKNLNTGTFVNGELHPRREKGPLFFQQTVRELVQTHRKQEEIVNHEIWPARQKLPGDATISRQDIDFCSRLDCETSNGSIAW